MEDGSGFGSSTGQCSGAASTGSRKNWNTGDRIPDSLLNLKHIILPPEPHPPYSQDEQVLFVCLLGGLYQVVFRVYSGLCTQESHLVEYIMELMVLMAPHNYVGKVLADPGSIPDVPYGPSSMTTSNS